MTRYFKGFLFLLFLFRIQAGFCQSAPDSLTGTGDSTDTGSEKKEGVVRVDENQDGGLSQPVTDSNYVFGDTIRRVSARQLKSYQLNPDYAYANDPEYWKKTKQRAPVSGFRFLANPVFRWIIFLAVIALVIYGIYQLARESDFKWRFRKSGKPAAGESDSAVAADEDYEKAVSECQTAGNYRLAIRYLYLRLIRTLHTKDGFKFRDSATNSEIALAFRNHPQEKDFRYLATAYEYIFYGEFIPGLPLYESLKNRFDDLQKKLDS